MTEREPDFYWNKLPVYRCRRCPYEKVDDVASVLAHELNHQPEVQTSALVGPNGEALKIEKGEDDHE